MHLKSYLTFKGENGSVRYFLKLELDESYAISYHAYKAFTFVQACWNLQLLCCVMLYSRDMK